MGKSTLQTAIAIANSSVGSAMIIFPLNYLNFGILENLVFLLLMGAILATTCSVFGMHLRPSETQITQSVKRILGENYFKAAALLSGILITLVSSLFFLLASDILYDVFIEIFGIQNLISGDLFLSEKLFKIFLMFGFATLTLLKKLDLVFKAAPFAMVSLVISTLVMIISFPLNISSLDDGAIKPKQFTLDGMLLVASINGFAFTCHPSISPILKENHNQKNNRKAIYLGFSISCVFYFIVGVCGSLAIYGKNPQKTSNVMDYFTGSWQAPLIGITNFIYFLMIFPIFPFVAKQQLTSLVPQEKTKNPNFGMMITIGFVVIWLGINTFFVISESSPGKLMGFLGSVVAFYFTYLLPGLIMLRAGKVFYIRSPKNVSTQSIDNGLLSTDSEDPSQNRYISHQNAQSLITSNNSSIHQPIQGQFTMSSPQDNQLIYDQSYTIRHQPLNIKDKIIFASILLVGVILFVSEIVDVIESL